MARINRDHLDKYYDYDLWLEGRTLYIGAQHVHAQMDGETALDEITAITTERVIKGLHLLQAQSLEKPIHIILNSGGGDVFQGFAIYDAIYSCQVPVQITATGQCMSAASIILQAGDIRKVTPNCILMVHDGEDGYQGSPDSFSNWAKMGQTINKQMYRIYAKSSGRSEKYWERRCKKSDFIMTAEEAIKEGLADSIAD